MIGFCIDPLRIEIAGKNLPLFKPRFCIGVLSDNCFGVADEEQ